MALAIKSTGQMTAAPTLGYLSDRLFAGIAAGYSVRQLLTSYSGPILRGRRSTGGAERDLTEAQLYDGTLASFAAGADVTVSKWYDQAGGNALTTPDISRQPLMVSGGTILKQDGRVIVQFDGTDDYLGATLNVPQPFNMFTTGLAPSTQKFGYIFEARDPGFPNGQGGKSVAMLSSLGTGAEDFYSGTDLSGGSPLPLGAQFSYAAGAGGGQAHLKNNRGGVYTGSSGSNGVGTLIVGANQNFGTFTNVALQELVFFGAVLNSSREDEIFRRAREYFSA